MFNFFRKKEKEKRDITTLVRYDLMFTTIDGKRHLYSGLKYCDINVDGVSPTEYIENRTFLIDNDAVCYPMTSVLQYEFLRADTVTAYAEWLEPRRYCIKQRWYEKSEIQKVESE